MRSEQGRVSGTFIQPTLCRVKLVGFDNIELIGDTV